MNDVEPGDIETLNLVVENKQALNQAEYVRLGVVEEDVRETGRVSFSMVQFRRAGGDLVYCQSFLSVDELDEMIAGIRAAQERVRGLLEGVPA